MQSEDSCKSETTIAESGANRFKHTLRVRSELIAVLGIIALTVAVYYPVIGFDFVDLDDDGYVFQNKQVQQGLTLEGVAYALRTFEMANWNPLTWLSYMTDIELFGMNPAGFHFTNAAMHLANAILLFVFLRLVTSRVWASAWVAVLFAVHPLHVESVAWISERKDVLSTFFWMLCMLAYIRYTQDNRRLSYGVAALLLILGLAAKPMLVTLPIVFFLLDYWPLGRLSPDYHSKTGHLSQPVPIKRLVLEKVPLFIISMVFGLVTLVAQKSFGAVQTIEMLPFANRIANALTSYIGYLVKMVWPVSLTVLYPYPGYIPASYIAGAVLFMGGVTTLAIVLRQRAPYFIFGWFWYLVTLLPVIGLIQAGNQAMADRYTYVPLIGIFVVIGWGIPDFFSKWNIPKQTLPAIALAILAILAAATRDQLHYWQDSVTLFRHTIAVTGDNYLAQNGLGIGYERQGRLDAAANHYRESLRISPGFSTARYNLGNVYLQLGHVDAAIEAYQRVLASDPEDLAVLNNLGKTFIKAERVPEALQMYRQALKIAPDDPGIQSNLGAALVLNGQWGAAEKLFAEIIRGNPDFADAYYNCGYVHELRGRLAAAGEYYAQALQIDPDHQQARKRQLKIEDRLKAMHVLDAGTE